VEAELWPGPAEAVRLISYEAENLKVSVTAAKDAVGAYGVVEVTKEAPKTPANDAGVSVSKPPEAKRFIGVEEVKKLVELLAPAKSYRSLGKIDAARLVDYGLDKPESKLSVTIGDKTHHLEIGGLTPGSSDYYVRDPEVGLVHTFSSEVVGRLKFADSRLLEHDMHDFRVDDLRAIEIHAAGKTRKVVRVEGKADVWADVATPNAPDETVSNWLAKVQRLRPQNYVEKPTNLPSSALVRVDYHDKAGASGWVELFRVADAPAKKYLARSERTRWYVDVPSTAAEPIEQDLAAVVK
jgi:hypothetical protein